MVFILTIVFVILALVGVYCLIKPDNFFLPYVNFYYNPKKSLKPIAYKGGLGAKHIKEFGKTKGILLYMRIFGLVLLLISIFFIIKTL